MEPILNAYFKALKSKSFINTFDEFMKENSFIITRIVQRNILVHKFIDHVIDNVKFVKKRISFKDFVN